MLPGKHEIGKQLANSQQSYAEHIQTTAPYLPPVSEYWLRWSVIS